MRRAEATAPRAPRPTLRLDRNARMEPVESALAVVSILVIISTFRSILLSGGDDANESGSILNQVVTFACSSAGIGLMLLYGVPGWLGRTLLRSWPILALTGLAIASVAWSLDPGATLRRGLALILFTGLVIYFVARFSIDEIVSLFLISFVIFAAVGYAAVLIPGQGITPSGMLGGTWRGLTGQKNEFGRICAMIIGMAVIVLTVRRSGHLRIWAGLLLGTFPLLVLSDSKTPLAAIIFALGMSVLLHALATRRIGNTRLTRGFSVFIGVSCVVLIVLAIAVILPLVLELLGRDLTFSGRLNLWNYVLDRSQDRQLLGAGFRAFWSDLNRQFYFEHFFWRSEDSGHAPFHSHSGYLDIRAELGWVGVVLLITLFVSTVRTILLGFAAGLRLSPALLSMMFHFVAVFCVTERGFLQYFDPVWFLFLLFYLMAKRELLFAKNHVPRQRAGNQVMATR